MSLDGQRKPAQNRGPRKRTMQVQKMLEDMNCNPVEGLATLALYYEKRARSAKGGMKSQHKLDDDVVTLNELECHQMASQCYRDLLPYFAARLKQIDMKVDANVVAYLFPEALPPSPGSAALRDESPEDGDSSGGDQPG